MSVGTARPQPRAPDVSGHCRTSTASTRCQWALPDLNREHQMSVGTARPHPRAPDVSGHCQTSTASYLSIHPSIHPIYLSNYLSIYLSISLSVCLSIYLSASLKTKLFCETASVFKLDNIQNEAIQRDVLNFCT